METNIYLELYKSERLLENLDQANLNKLMINFGLLHNAIGFAFIEITKAMSHLLSTSQNSNVSSSKQIILENCMIKNPDLPPPSQNLEIESNYDDKKLIKSDSFLYETLKNSNENILLSSKQILLETALPPPSLNLELPPPSQNLEIESNDDDLKKFKFSSFLCESLKKSNENFIEVENNSNKGEKCLPGIGSLANRSTKNIFELDERGGGKQSNTEPEEGEGEKQSNEKCENLKENLPKKNYHETFEILVEKNEPNEILEIVGTEKSSLLKYTKKFKKKKSDLEVEPILRKVKYEEGGRDPFLGRKEKKTYRLKKEEKIELSQIEVGKGRMRVGESRVGVEVGVGGRLGVEIGVGLGGREREGVRGEVGAGIGVRGGGNPNPNPRRAGEKGGTAGAGVEERAEAGAITGVEEGAEERSEKGTGVRNNIHLDKKKEKEEFLSKVTKKIVDKDEAYRSTFRKKCEREVLEGFSCHQCDKVFSSFYLQLLIYLNLREIKPF